MNDSSRQQQSVAPSSVSHSASSMTNENKRKIISGNFSRLDHIFPLYDAITQKSKLPGFFVIIYIVYTFVQIIACAQNGQLLDVTYDKRNGMDITYFFTIFGLFICGTQINYMMMAIFIVLAVCVLFSMLAYSMSQIVYSRTRTYPKFVLYVLRVAVDFLVPLTILPISQYIGALSYYVVYNYDEVLPLVFLVLSCLFYFYTIFLLYISFTLIYSSPFLPPQDFVPWNPKFLINFYLVQSIFQFLGGFLRIFPFWIKPILCVFHILYDIILIIKLTNIQFISLGYNNFLIATFCGCIGGEAMQLVYSLFDPPKFAVWYAMVVTVGVMLISLAFVIPLMKWKISKAVQFLEKDDVIEEDFFERNLKNEKNALFHLYIGIIKMSTHFLDWTLIKYLGSFNEQSDVLFELIRIVSWFPGESRFQNMIFRQAMARRKIDFRQRFILYQVDRIKSVRLSSSSIDVTEILNKMTHQTSSCMDEVCGFWKDIPSKPGVFTNLGQMLKSINFEWLEALNSYPNSFRFREEYAKFLIDCYSDYYGGIKQKYLAGLIDQGYSFAVDQAFRNFIYTFPLYVKRKVVDLRGNLIKSNKNKSGSKSSTSSNGLSTLTSMTEMDAEIQDRIGRSMFKQSRMRLSMQSAIEDRPSAYLTRLLIVAILALIVQLVMALFVFFMMYNIYDDRLTAMKRMFALNEARSYIGIASCSVLNQMAHKFNQIDLPTLQYAIDMGEGENYQDLLKLNYLPIVTRETMKMAKNSMEELVKLITDFALSGGDAGIIAPQFVKSTETLTFCGLNATAGFLYPLKRPSNVSIQSLFMNIYDSVIELSLDNGDWAKSKHMCTAVNNYYNFKKSSESLALSFIEEESQNIEHFNSYHFQYELISTLVSFVLTAIPHIIIVVLFHFELKKMLKLMKTCDSAAVDAASHAIIKTDEEEPPHTLSLENSKKNIFVGIATVILYTAFALIIFSNVYISEQNLLTFTYYNSFVYLSTSRKPITIESWYTTQLSMVFMFRGIMTVYDFGALTNDAKAWIRVASIFHNSLISGTVDTPPCIGYNEELDKINLQAPCEDHTTYHNVIKCSSIQQDIDNALTLYFEVILPALTTGMRNFSDKKFYNMQHIMMTHLLDLYDQSEIIMKRMVDELLEDYKRQMITFVVIELILALAIFIFVYWEISFLKVTYKAVLTLLLRLPPISVVNNERLLDFLLNRETKNSTEMDTSRSIIHNSSDAILCLSKNEIIEIVNGSVANLLGYTPEQLLGQPLSILLTEESETEINQQISMMRLGQCALQYECHSICLSDDDTHIACHTTVIGMGERVATSFVVLFRNEEELLNQQRIAEQAKNQSETLLYQILPRDIVTRLNAGEKDISFSVPSATICFIDIQRFSDYAASLTPSQIMGHLSMIFDSYDKIIAKYPMIIKIKLIGDIYMAAGGLFNPDDPPATHAEQVVRFALDGLAELEDINMKLTSSLQVRIGVNTGGPLIAGVLGTDKPVFDIIGDPINVAARLQSTDIPGRIQISPTTYELINALDFQIEKRGEIFLKGKGKIISYLVTPSPTSLNAGLTDPSLTFLITSNTSMKESMTKTSDDPAN